MSKELVIGKVRFSYPHVFQPHSSEEGKEKKYSISLLIAKKDKALVKRLKDAIDEVKKDPDSSRVWGGKIPANLKTPLRDGDLEREDEAYKDHFFMNCSSKRRPGIVDENLNKIISEDDFKAGDYGRANINIYAYNWNGTKGIAVGLNNLQKLEDGESLAGGRTAEEAFGSESDDADLM